MFKRFREMLMLMILIIVGNSSFSNGIDMDDLKKAIPGFKFASDCKKLYLTPENHFCSIVYLLFTQDNKSSPCYFEPRQENFNDCKFDPCRETKILIHGYETKLLPGNQFEKTKDALLSTDDYNVIIVDWTRYNQDSYEQAFAGVPTVGNEVAKTIKFLMKKKGANAADIHMIGHSLGAHISGVAGKNVGNIGRITGLDPAAQLFNINFGDRLGAGDANFVDVIHCSDGINGKGYGFPSPMGDIDFYPNGGDKQPACKLGGKYTNTDSVMHETKTKKDIGHCSHDICPLYFLNSIKKCEFISTECDDYRSYQRRKCKTNPTTRMGLHTSKDEGVASNTKFFLKTSKNAPHCLDPK